MSREDIDRDIFLWGRAYVEMLPDGSQRRIPAHRVIVHTTLPPSGENRPVGYSNSNPAMNAHFLIERLGEEMDRIRFKLPMGDSSMAQACRQLLGYMDRILIQLANYLSSATE